MGEPAESQEAPLLSRLRAGDTQAFESLVRENQGPLYNLLARLTGDPDEALDLVQETFLRAFRGMASFRGESAVKTWLHRIAMNVFLNERRGPRRETVDVQTLEELSPGWWDRWSGRMPDPEQLAIRREESRRLGGIIARLPEEYRAVLLLRDREEYSAHEVAEMLEISESAVKSRLHRARMYVRKEFLKKAGK
ncbi:MAG: sigma-70 family RNA polymerase sigma factor [Candidatus Tectomicrobia bacterium]|uniref:RNA polymerase sigma factor n=1 Tax=Tectimicrobiota bacterium TaxID=2528274 RepID=A0A932HZ88_UNCTE|nr:sigma-70 family RNA polymerase sigma factor [Candidatus Tectomicrobia bacterium]